MINFIKQKNDMKKLAYIVITSSMFLTTSCVDLTQEPQSFITEEEYIGSMALITGHQATSGNPCEGKLTDQFGQIHYLLLEPEEGKIFTKGDKVLIICRLSATRYLAENNPWPQIL